MAGALAAAGKMSRLVVLAGRLASREHPAARATIPPRRPQAFRQQAVQRAGWQRGMPSGGSSIVRRYTAGTSEADIGADARPRANEAVAIQRITGCPALGVSMPTEK
jgi:hypothetical protein